MTDIPTVSIQIKNRITWDEVLEEFRKIEGLTGKEKERQEKFAESSKTMWMLQNHKPRKLQTKYTVEWDLSGIDPDFRFAFWKPEDTL